MQAMVVLDHYYEDPLVCANTFGAEIRRLVIVKDGKKIVFTSWKGHVYMNTSGFNVKAKGRKVLSRFDTGERFVNHLIAVSETQKQLADHISKLLE
jgi:hypothetical protein